MAVPCFLGAALGCGSSEPSDENTPGDASSGGSTGAGGSAGSSGGSGGDTTVSEAGPPLDAGDPGAADVTFEIASDRAVRPISPWIYGWNGSAGDKSGQTVARSGGNRLTAYNWENNASNAGRDYCFENDGLLGASANPGEAVRSMVETMISRKGSSIITIPVVDYVSADKNGGSAPPDCSGDVRKSGAGYLGTRFKQNKAQKGAAFAASPDANDAFVYQDEFVNWMRTNFTGARLFFSLDNEPDLWSATHAEIHPSPVTYAELVQRDITFARGIKAAWPEAQVTGPVSYGWNGYVTLQNASDRGGRDFLEFYLDKMHEAEAGEGRLLDYLDLHWYSEATGDGGGLGVLRVNDPGTDHHDAMTSSSLVAAREQSTRSLWDPNYLEASWITNDVLHAPIRLIPRMLEKIAAHYPSTKLAFTEWDYGAGWHISGAIATADALGIFGREGVELASYWPLDSDESYAEAGLRAFRNFDGAGGTFADTSIGATTSDGEGTSVYASMDAANPARVVIVAINKKTSATTAAVRIVHPMLFAKAAVYTLTSAGPELVPGASLDAKATNAFLYTMPAQSVSVLVPGP
jgi:hypothetical protein